MATKAAKSITINATKYELANALAVSDGKIQLKAKDVLLSEVEAPGEDAFIIKFNSNQSMFADGAKTCETFNTADLIAAVKAGTPIKMICEGIETDGSDWFGAMVFVPTVYFSEMNSTIYFNGYFPAAANVKKQFYVGAQNATISSINLDTV